MMAPPRAVVALGAGAASMGAALAVNLAVIGLVEMLAVAFGEEDEEEDQTNQNEQILRLRPRSGQLDNFL